MSENKTENKSESKKEAFTKAMYGAVGGAAFCGLLGMLGSGLAHTIMHGGKIADAFSPLMLTAMGGLVAAGTGLIYMSLDKEEPASTKPAPELSQNTPAVQREREPGLAIEQTKSGRSDGKKWTEAAPANVVESLQR